VFLVLRRSIFGATLPLLLALTSVSGCSSYGTGPYEPKAFAAIGSGGRGVNVGSFTAATPGQTEVQCRAFGRIRVLQDGGFEDFIRQALILELEKAGVLSNTGHTITGYLRRLDVATMIPMGRWTIELSLTSSNGRTLVHTQTYDYSVGGVGDDPCLATASQFVPAVQSVMRHLFERADFIGLLK
jgi:hypothetical protein